MQDLEDDNDNVAAIVIDQPPMGKLAREKEEEPLISSFRRGMIRYGIRRYLFVGLSVILLFLLLRWFNRQPSFNSTGRVGYKGELEIMTPPIEPKPVLNTVNLDVYMESQCPDTSRFVHQQLMKAWSSLGSTGRIQLTLIPFGKARCVEKNGDYECSCQHGNNECLLNQLMNCVIDRIGIPNDYLPIVNCIQGKPGLDVALSSCVANEQKLHLSQMRDCASGTRGRTLLAMAGSKTVGLKPPLSFVPWIVIDEERNSDALYDLTENLCKKLEPAPEACAIYEKI